MQFDRRTCGKIVQVTRIPHFTQIITLLAESLPSFLSPSSFLTYLGKIETTLLTGQQIK